LAASCPDAEGDAVFIARARLAELGQDAFYDDYTLCAKTGPRSAAIVSKSDAKDHASDDLVVWPNPAGNNFFIKTRVPMSYIRLIDLSGKLIRRWQAASDEIRLESGDLGAGLYILEVTLNDGTRITESIVLNGNR
jgi:type IX secretion system substrate protein